MWNDGMTPPLLAEANQARAAPASPPPLIIERRDEDRSPNMPVTCHRSMFFLSQLMG